MTPERLEVLIKRAGENPTSVALGINRDKDYVRDYIKGRKQTIKADDLVEILAYLRPKIDDELPNYTVVDSDEIEVVGVVQAGAWLETYARNSEEKSETIPVARDPRFPEARQYALKVIGDSMDQEVKDGAYAICVAFGDAGLEKKAGMIVHVERIRPETSETTLKAIEMENGRMVLKPRSSNPVHKPIYRDQSLGEEVVIRGLVLSFYDPKPL